MIGYYNYLFERVVRTSPQPGAHISDLNGITIAIDSISGFYAIIRIRYPVSIFASYKLKAAAYFAQRCEWQNDYLTIAVDLQNANLSYLFSFPLLALDYQLRHCGFLSFSDYSIKLENDCFNYAVKLLSADDAFFGFTIVYAAGIEGRISDTDDKILEFALPESSIAPLAFVAQLKALIYQSKYELARWSKRICEDLEAKLPIK